MNPDNIPFNCLIVGPTNCGKTKYLVDILSGDFRRKFDYIVLICPTYDYNKTYKKFADMDDDFIVFSPKQDQIERYLKFVTDTFEETNTLIILDDCAASKEVKKRSNELVDLAFSARHKGISVWFLTQQFNAVVTSFRLNIAYCVLFYTRSALDLKYVFDNYGGDLTKEDVNKIVITLKNNPYSNVVFSLKEPYDTIVQI